jgi:hypothetical protein
LNEAGVKAGQIGGLKDGVLVGGEVRGIGDFLSSSISIPSDTIILGIINLGLIRGGEIHLTEAKLASTFLDRKTLT